MTSAKSPTAPSLRLYCVEDNPLIVFHLEQLIEDAGHIFVGSANSFSQLKADLEITDINGALVDIDLADGATGPEAAAWLKARGVPSLFVTGQEGIAARYPDVTRGIIVKPIVTTDFADKLMLLED
ncbi:response regulator [Sphingomonas sp. JC676]|uniref:response regulator n=1 Tax=Sphingomonas sp. JC676 TaxID=2768065 RepID=UPI001657E521|nr:response regulator [Sphingomonas sp. JC676]MBC9033715.1 response regulator [Sphingomonas sp. JC676]